METVRAGKFSQTSQNITLLSNFGIIFYIMGQNHPKPEDLRKLF